MTNSGYSVGRGNDLAGIQANAATTAPDFVRHDRGDEDDNWAHAFGTPCARCDYLIEEGEWVRRRGSGDWVHQRCPVRMPVDD
jgi:hypothetical protein